MAGMQADGNSDLFTKRASYGQARLWAVEQASNNANSQIVPLVYQIDGWLDVPHLEWCLATTVARHEALHSILKFDQGTVFYSPGLKQFSLEIAELAHYNEPVSSAYADLEVEFLSRRFDLASDLMLRALLVKESGNRHRLVICIHHCAGDGASFDILQGQISRLYDGETPDEVFKDTMPYSAYLDSIAKLESSGRFEKPLYQAAKEISDGNFLSRSLGRAAVAGKQDPDFFRFQIDSVVHLRLTALGSRYAGVGPSGIYLAAFQILLSMLYRSHDVAVGFPVENRSDPQCSEMVGFLTNTVPIPVTVNPHQTVGEYLSARGQNMISYRHRLSLPYGLLLERLHGEPFRFDLVPFDALLTYQPRKRSSLTLANCIVAVGEPAVWPVPFDFMLDIEEAEESASALFRWNSALYPRSLVEVTVEVYTSLLDEMSRNVNQIVGDLQRSLLGVLAAGEQLERRRFLARRFQHLRHFTDTEAPTTEM